MNRLQADINGQTVHYYEWGKKENPTIVCLHGLTNTGQSFSELAEFMKDDYHVLAFDNPGHGNTSPFHDKNQYLFSNITTWYNSIFQQILKKPFLILGHSWGADIALHCSIRNRQGIKGVILLDGGFTFPEHETGMTFSKAYDGWADYMDGAKYLGVEEVFAEYKGYTRRWNKQIEQMVLSMFRFEKHYELISTKFTVLSVITAFFEEPFSTTYPQIGVPLLLLHATIPENSAARETGVTLLKNRIRNARIIGIHGAGHIVHWDNPGQVCEAIKTWASDVLLN